ncbi:MAG TPA: NADH-quinone oxidoreductase subunit L, partial [Candidatus Dormibacteraeota bacterium]|nr:NADH-quinone oxidoreductase subunit L [Candidatus Dormibacteraeota bacterium]
MTVGQLLVVALLLPLAGFLINRLYGPRNRGTVQIVGPTAVGLSFLLFLLAALFSGGGAGDHLVYHWLAGAGGSAAGVAVPTVDVSLYLDPLSVVMTLVVTGVGCLIHVYAVGYMDEEGDEDYARFFAHMNLFIFSMLLLVLARNFVLLTVGWALVGLSSYLLIGFHRERPAAVAAARKAFVMNVIGDVGIVIASFIVYRATGSLDFSAFFAALPGIDQGTLELIGLFLLVGAVAKSAQVPLHTWLPDAMEGPTPVSALIHAATMVTAGVYLIARFHPLYSLATGAASTAAIIGLVTALMAALVACVQTDIKRVLAYSTMSQIGYMFFAVAAGAESAGIFHLVTHAFFKALLFLAAGSVIHALHGEQDMRGMGGLWRRMPVTGAVFLVGALALAGVIPLSGSFSKDEIIGAGLIAGPAAPLGGIALALVAGLTGYYMLRAFWLVFLAEPAGQTVPGGETSRATGPHDPPTAMAIPVLILCVLSAVAGLIIQPGFWHLLTDYTANVFGAEPEPSLAISVIAVVLSLLVVLVGVGIAYQRFGRPEVRASSAASVPDTTSVPVLGHAFYWDRFYQAV